MTSLIPNACASHSLRYSRKELPTNVGFSTANPDQRPITSCQALKNGIELPTISLIRVFSARSYITSRTSFSAAARACCSISSMFFCEIRTLPSGSDSTATRRRSSRSYFVRKNGLRASSSVGSVPNILNRFSVYPNKLSLMPWRAAPWCETGSGATALANPGLDSRIASIWLCRVLPSPSDTSLFSLRVTAFHDGFWPMRAWSRSSGK